MSAKNDFFLFPVGNIQCLLSEINLAASLSQFLLQTCYSTALHRFCRKEIAYLCFGPNSTQLTFQHR